MLRLLALLILAIVLFACYEPALTVMPPARSETVIGFDGPQTIQGVTVAVNSAHLTPFTLELADKLTAIDPGHAYTIIDKEPLTVGWMEITVSNQSSNLVKIHAGTGDITIGGETIDGYQTKFFGDAHTLTSNEFPPGETVTATLYFPVSAAYESLSGATFSYAVAAPNYEGDGYTFSARIP